jgi:hypothetical protein
MKFVAGFFLFAGVLAHAASLHDKALAFEKEVKAATANQSPAYPGVPAPDVSTVEPLLHDEQNLPMLENVIRQLMATRSSPGVERAGNELLDALEQEQKYKAQAFIAQAESILRQAKKIVGQAKSPADLDGLLARLRPLTDTPNQGSYSDPTAMDLVQKLNSVQQFVLAWQDYLSASASGQGDAARQALERILDNPQVGALDFLPRSELLLRRDGPPFVPAAAPPPGKDARDQVNDILSKVRTLDDVFTAVNEIGKIPNPPVDLSDISTLQKQRVDVEAGLPVTLDLKAAVSGHTYGDDISRIENMELLALLPYYLETHNSNPPKPGETVVSYLNRLETEADAAGNLALLQRALAVHDGLDNAENQNPADATSQFLGGLSQDAAGEYEQAVATYEKALQTYSPLLSAKIVGDRLAAIKAAHPDEFAKGLADALAPPLPNVQLGMPGWQPGYPRFYPPQTIAELPIPLVISIPAHNENSAAPPARK